MRVYDEVGEMTHWRETCAIKSFVVHWSVTNHMTRVSQTFMGRDGTTIDRYDLDGVSYKPSGVYLRYRRRTEKKK